MVTFVNASLKQFLGFIGVNSFDMHGETVHMMVAVKPGIPQKLIGVVKNGRGEPLVGATIQFPAHLVAVGQPPQN